MLAFYGGGSVGLSKYTHLQVPYRVSTGALNLYIGYMETPGLGLRILGLALRVVRFRV